MSVEELFLNAMGTQPDTTGQFDPTDLMQQFQAEFSGFDPDVVAQVAPLMRQRGELQTILGKQLEDYNRLLGSTENARVGGLSTGQGIASALVGILPTLVAAAFGGKDAAADAAGAGVKGMEVYRQLQNEEQKNDLQRLLGLTRNQAALAGRTQGQIGALDRQMTQAAVQRQNQKDRLEDRALSREQAQQNFAANFGLKEAMLEIAKQKADAANAPFSPVLIERIKEVQEGKSPNVDNLSPKEAAYLLDFWGEARRQRGQEVSEQSLDLRKDQFKANTTSGTLANIPGLVPTKEETKAANVASKSLSAIKRNATALAKQLETEGVKFFGPMAGEQQRLFSTLIEELKNLKGQGANFTFMERGINLDQITSGVDFADFRDTILKTTMYGRSPAEALRNFIKEMEAQAQFVQVSNKYYDPDEVYSDDLIRKVARIHGREAAKALLRSRGK